MLTKNYSKVNAPPAINYDGAASKQTSLRRNDFAPQQVTF